MPLLNYNLQALTQGLRDDIQSFDSLIPDHVSYTPALVTEFDTFSSIQTTIEKYVSTMDVILQRIDTSNSGEKLSIKKKNFDYSHDIHTVKKIDPEAANQLWRLRHEIFFQILIVTFHIASNQTLFEDVYSIIFESRSTEISKRSFNENVTGDLLEKFKLGIWGTNSVTSDIDIGIQDSSIVGRVPGVIAYVVSIFEDLFLYVVGMSTLKFDIEPYADLMFIDEDTNMGPVTRFYCDTTDFSFADLMNCAENSSSSIMANIGASIIRNFMQSQIDHDGISDCRRCSLVDDCRMQIIDISRKIESFEFDNANMRELNLLKQNIIFQSLFDTSDEAVKKWMMQAKAVSVDYLTNPYERSREMYYQKVATAEKIFSDNMDLLLRDTNKTNSKNTRREMILAISEALNYRAESYVSPSTVMHIVRSMQSKAAEAISCDDIFPSPYARCALGPIGYIMSVLEQAGFLMRYRLTYCEDCSVPQSKIPESTCKRDSCHKKMNKYFPRLQNGLLGLEDGNSFKVSDISKLIDLFKSLAYSSTVKKAGEKKHGKRRKKSRILKSRDGSRKRKMSIRKK